MNSEVWKKERRARSIYGLVKKQGELSSAASPYMGMSRVALPCEPTAKYENATYRITEFRTGMSNIN